MTADLRRVSGSRGRFSLFLGDSRVGWGGFRAVFLPVDWKPSFFFNYFLGSSLRFYSREYAEIFEGDEAGPNWIFASGGAGLGRFVGEGFCFVEVAGAGGA